MLISDYTTRHHLITDGFQDWKMNDEEESWHHFLFQTNLIFSMELSFSYNAKDSFILYQVMSTPFLKKMFWFWRRKLWSNRINFYWFNNFVFNVNHKILFNWITTKKSSRKINPSVCLKFYSHKYLNVAAWKIIRLFLVAPDWARLVDQ